MCRSAPVPCPARSPRPPPCPSLPPQHAPDLPRKSSEIEAALCSDSRACAYPMPGRTAAGRSYRGGRSRRTCPSAPRAACCAAIPRCVRRCGGCPQESAAAPPPPRGSLRARPWHTNCPMPHATLKTEESRRDGEKRPKTAISQNRSQFWEMAVLGRSGRLLGRRPPFGVLSGLSGALPLNRPHPPPVVGPAARGAAGVDA